MEKVTAIILAAGKGRRMESDIQKQYMLLEGKPILWYSLDTFEKSSVDSIVLVVGKGEIEYCRKEMVERYGFKKVSHIVEGGQERYDSVYEGLKAAEESGYVLIHDGARPFITAELITLNIETAKKEKACATGMPIKDTIKMIDVEEYAIYTPTRSHVWLIQTPQSFEYRLIRDGYEKLMAKEEKEVTDDAMIVERLMRQKVKLIRGSYENIKITTPEDLVMAQGFVVKRRL